MHACTHTHTRAHTYTHIYYCKFDNTWTSTYTRIYTCKLHTQHLNMNTHQAYPYTNKHSQVIRKKLIYMII